jgi:acetylglutamate kinase
MAIIACIFMHMKHNYASPFPPGPLVIKYGGNALPPGGRVADPVLEEVVALAQAGTRLVVVHGGGPEIDRWLQARGVPTRRVDGLRVTDEATLEITEAVLCATINKRLVRACAALGARAAGISGEDARTLVAQTARGSRGEDLGYVGEVIASDSTLLRTLLDAGFLPIVAPLAIATDAAHAYNVNADLAAAAIAGALQASAFIIITNVTRVLRDPRDPASAIDRMTLDEARAFANTSACVEGMQPKMNAAVCALMTGAAQAYICDARPNPITRALAGDATTIR